MNRTLWQGEARATLALAYPLILTNLAQSLIQATDVVLLGWAGPRTLAAGALGVNLVTACLIFGIGLVTAAAPMIARALGRRAHDVRDVRRTVRQCFWVAAVAVVPMWLLLWHAEALLVLMHQDRALAAGAAHLVRPMMFGMLPAFLYTVLRAFVSALERPGWAFLAGGTAVITNALGNYALIFGHFGLPALGLFGAGLGSALSNTLMFLMLALVVVRHRRFRRYHLFGRWWRADWARFRAIARLGLPIAVTLTLEVTIFNAAVFLMGLIGTAELAAHAVAIQLAAFCFMVPLGLAQAATVRVGLAYGRRDRAAVARAGWSAFAITMAVMSSTALLLFVARRPLVGLFLDLADPAEARVVALATAFLGVAALFQLVDGAQAVGAGMLRGLHDTTVPMLFALIGYWVVALGIAVFLAFGLGWGGIGVWIGLAAGLATVALLMIGRWARRDRLGLMPR
ncbi:MATE family efflux transporter [Sphingomonas morindae]|uniref:Multidrug-efflux transporter n=1 Tax=Sphingomonas morindae TaxID=1541170 RepID=A0ABY4XAZ1_9SPHN|nr:MATE family efflux transporter [Sphingomonas morindae]USI74069.1 MATE family efflux transporter [Sphingomonas morindae]